MELSEGELPLRYQSFCDPRLNFEQSLGEPSFAMSYPASHSTAHRVQRRTLAKKKCSRTFTDATYRFADVAFLLSNHFKQERKDEATHAQKKQASNAAPQQGRRDVLFAELGGKRA